MDPNLRILKSEKRTLKISGEETSIAVEKAFWDVIDHFALQARHPWQQVVQIVIDAHPGSRGSRAALLRVWCLQKLKVMALKHVSRPPSKAG